MLNALIVASLTAIFAICYRARGGGLAGLAYTAYGVTKCLDVAQYVESGTTGLWVPLTTYDLTHPSVSGHALMIAGVSGQFASVALPT